MSVRDRFSLVAVLVWLQGCAALSSNAVPEIPAPQAPVVAEDLAQVIAARWQPFGKPLYLVKVPPELELETALRAQGYAVTLDAELGVPIEAGVQHIPPNDWRVELTVDESMHVHRLYRIEENQVAALSAITMGSHPVVSALIESKDPSPWKLLQRSSRSAPPLVKKPSVLDSGVTVVATDTASQTPTQHEHYTPLRADGKKNTNDVEMRKEANDLSLTGTSPDLSASAPLNACLASPGTTLSLPTGSLLHGIASALGRCGWQIGAWPELDGQPSQVIDWVVPEELTLNVRTVDELLDHLELEFGLQTTTNARLRVVDVSLKQ